MPPALVQAIPDFFPTFDAARAIDCRTALDPIDRAQMPGSAFTAIAPLPTIAGRNDDAATG